MGSQAQPGQRITPLQVGLVQESGKVSCSPFTAGLVVRAVRSVCFFLLRFPLGRQFPPQSAALVFAEGSSATTSLQEVLWETTLQRVSCHVPSHQMCPASSPRVHGAVFCCSPQSRGKCWWPLSAVLAVPNAASFPCVCFVLLSRLVLLCL